MNQEYAFLKDIPGSEHFKSTTTVGGGWSSDIKFHIETDDGKHFLMRVSDIAQLDKKRKEYDVLQKLAGTGINYSKPYLFGTSQKHGIVYMILDWIDGDNVEIMMPKLSKEKQYECGFTAGKYLRRMHQIDGKVDIEAWRNKNLKKLNERLELLKQCEDRYHMNHLEEMVAFINNNMDCLENRKMVFLHGDYQGRNIVVDVDGTVGVIDFERTAEGDGYEEFNRMMTYTRKWSVDFCKGQIDGYFDGEEIPELFWRCNAFHCALNLITTIAFGVYNNKEEIYTENQESSDIIFDDLDGYTNLIPSWYRK